MNTAERKDFATKVEDFNELTSELKRLAEKNEISFEHAIKIYELLSFERKTDTYVNNGFMMDEKIDDINKNLEKIAIYLSD